MDIVANDVKKKMHPYKFTMWVAIGSVVMMFAGLTSAFIVKSNFTNFRLEEFPKVFWFSTAVILLSSLTVQWAVRSLKDREMLRYRLMIALTALLGFAFVALQWMGFEQLWAQNIRFKGGNAGQFLYVLFGLHALHVLGGVVALAVMLYKAFAGKVKVYSSVGIEIMSVYWHFVDLLWIYLLIFFLIVGSA